MGMTDDVQYALSIIDLGPFANLPCFYEWAEAHPDACREAADLWWQRIAPVQADEIHGLRYWVEG